jgi:hypothetical protein
VLNLAGMVFMYILISLNKLISDLIYYSSQSNSSNNTNNLFSVGNSFEDNSFDKNTNGSGENSSRPLGYPGNPGNPEDPDDPNSKEAAKEEENKDEFKNKTSKAYKAEMKLSTF